VQQVDEANRTVNDHSHLDLLNNTVVTETAAPIPPSSLHKEQEGFKTESDFNDLKINAQKLQDFIRLKHPRNKDN
jgi:hypothetical protein